MSDTWFSPADVAEGLGSDAQAVARTWVKRHTAHGGYLSTTDSFLTNRRSVSCSHCFKRLVVSRDGTVEELEYESEFLDAPTRTNRLTAPERPRLRPEPRADDGSRAKVALSEDV